MQCKTLAKMRKCKCKTLGHVLIYAITSEPLCLSSFYPEHDHNLNGFKLLLLLYCSQFDCFIFLFHVQFRGDGGVDYELLKRSRPTFLNLEFTFFTHRLSAAG